MRLNLMNALNSLRETKPAINRRRLFERISISSKRIFNYFQNFNESLQLICLRAPTENIATDQRCHGNLLMLILQYKITLSASQQIYDVMTWNPKRKSSASIVGQFV